MSKYGDVSYAKICMDKEKGISKGTGFVCYKKRGVCEQIINDSYMFSTGNKESDIEINGRHLILQKAIDKGNAKEKTQQNTLLSKKLTKIKDSRNISLAAVGQKTKEE